VGGTEWVLILVISKFPPVSEERELIFCSMKRNVPVKILKHFQTKTTRNTHTTGMFRII
jgi:hypothetical protein